MGARPQSRSEGLLSRSRSPGARGLRADRPPPRHESLVQSPRGSVTEPGQTLRAGPARVSHTGLPGLSPGWSPVAALKVFPSFQQTTRGCDEGYRQQSREHSRGPLCPQHDAHAGFITWHLHPRLKPRKASLVAAYFLPSLLKRSKNVHAIFPASFLPSPGYESVAGT